MKEVWLIQKFGWNRNFEKLGKDLLEVRQRFLTL